MDSSFDICIPLIVDDICVSEDKFCGKTKYFMASEKKEQFFKLNEMQYRFFSEFLPYALKERNVTKLEEKCQIISDGKVSLEMILRMLHKHNLFEENESGITSKVTIDYNSKKLIEVKLDELNKYQNLWKILFYIIFSISLIVIGILVLEMFLNYQKLFEVIGNVKFSANNLSIGTIFAIVLVTGMSIILHEIGHLLVAQVLGIEWKSISIAFIWGVSPIFYVRYKNFCVHKSRDKVKVLIMGTFMNFIQFLVYMQLSLFTENWIFSVGMILNAGCIISFILPFGTSDGYQIMAIILGVEEARWRALTMIGQILKNPKELKNIIKKKEDLIFIVYTGIAYITGILGCTQLLKSILSFFDLINVTNRSIIMVVILFFVISTVIYAVKFVRNIRHINS